MQSGEIMAYDYDVPLVLGVPLEPGSNDVLLVEVNRREVPSGLVLASPSPGEIADRAKVSLEEAIAKVKPSLHKIVGMLKDLSPDETELEFGLKIGGETGIIVAKGTAEVNFTIRVTWKGDKSA